MQPQELKDRLASSAFAFRGYNVTNLGRSYELLSHPKYGPVVEDCLREAGRVCSDVIGKRVNLVTRVKHERQTSLKTYADAIALILAMEQAQVRLLAEFFDIEMKDARFSMGYSLGEIAAVALGGVWDLSDAMRVPLALAEDSADLATDVSLGVLFSRGTYMPFDVTRRICIEVNQTGQGVMGISAFLSPNSLLVMGQGSTLRDFKARLNEFPDKTNLRINEHHFPPLHTPIVRQRYIPNRAAVLMQTIAGGITEPKPKVLSLVTGDYSYTAYNAREILHQWIDHPQLLWEAVYETLSAGIHTIIHVGPEPNIIPATFKRLQENVEAETKGKIGMRALTAVVQHPWLKRLLSERTALLQATGVQQIILEDWLLEQDPPA
ncbi:MAG: ACP S-malonyltransferase [Planctomycetaceae bacterium]|nr:ACP S-malonyltransferase [Planctomycetaceae bacterium]